MVTSVEFERQAAWLYTPEFRAFLRGALSTGVRDFNSFVAPVKLQPLIGSSRKENSSVARKRYQQGSVKLIGNKKNKKWVGRYREDVIESDGTTRRIRREVILGSKRDLPTERLAQRRMEAKLVHINAIDYRPGRFTTFEEFIERWKTEVLPMQKPSSARAVRSHLRCYILPELGKIRLDQLGVENQQRFITRVPERAANRAVSRKTILNILGTVSAILTTARDWGYTSEKIDLARIHLPTRAARHEARSFSVEQLQQILAAAEEPWRSLFYILTMTGLRAGEVLALQWGDIDFDRRVLHIRRSAWYGKIQTAKSEASESVLPIPGALVSVLKNHRSQWKPNAQNFLFVTRNGRPPSSNKVVEYHLWPVLDALGIPRCGIHAFRHSHAALLLDTGATPKVAQRQLRHSDARTTLEVYGHIVGDAQREAVEKVAALLDGNGRKLTSREKWIQ